MAKRDNSKHKAAYISEAVKKAEQYKKDVESGKQTANEWIKLAVQRSRKDEARTDIFYNKKAVERVYDFFYYAKISTGARYRRMQLTPYQAWILSELFGWYFTKDKEKRRYRYALLYTARKSGKTVFFVIVEFLILIADYQEAPEAYLCATTKEQAGQALKYSKAIIKHSPALARRLTVQQFQILYKKRDGLLKVLANKPNNNDSLNPSIFILDEMHAHETLAFYNVMKSGIMFRKNPFGIITSTAGFNKDYPFYNMVETGKKVLQGVVEDDITFYALYTLDEEAEIEKPEAWVKANPNINVTVDLEDLEAEYKKACLTVTEKNNFITKNLNWYLDNLDQWLPDEQYKKLFLPVDLPTNRPKAYVGLDMATTRDLAALVVVWTDETTGKLNVYPEFFFPNNPDRKIRASGIDLTEWIEKGHIQHHETASISEELVVERFRQLNEIFDIRRVNYDKWNANFLASKLMADPLFLDCKHFEQNATWFNFPLKYVERLFFDENIVMGTNPVLRWNFRNIVLWYDGNGNIKIMKNKSRDSVDGAVSLGMAVAGWLEDNSDTTAQFFRELMASQYGDQTA